MRLRDYLCSSFKPFITTNSQMGSTLFWKLEGLQYGKWDAGINEDSIFSKDLQVRNFVKKCPLKGPFQGHAREEGRGSQ